MQNSQPLLHTLGTVLASFRPRKWDEGKVENLGIQVRDTDFSVAAESAEIETEGPTTEGHKWPLIPQDLPEWLNYCRL